jgi:hypothetical protein
MVGCQTAKLSDIEVCPLEDPFTGEGYCVTTVTGRERVIPKDQWQKMRRTYVLLSPESWATLKNDNQENCYKFKQCEVLMKNVDELLLTIDKNVKKAVELGVIK